MDYKFDRAALKELRARTPGHFQPFPYGSFLDAVRALTDAETIKPWFHQEVGLVSYGRSPPQIYVVNGDIESISFADVKAAKGQPDVNLHTHPISTHAFFPTDDDFRYLTGYGNSFILSRVSGGHYLTKYGVHARFGSLAIGTCIWPENEEGTVVHYQYLGPNEPRELEALVGEKPIRPESGIIRVLKPEEGVAIDVLPLGLVEQLYASHGDDMFYNPNIDWYEEGKKLIRAVKPV